MRILGEYSSYLLYPMIAVVTAYTVVSFALYAIAPETLSIFGTDRLVWTRPSERGAPTKALLEDRPIHVASALWAAPGVTSTYHARESG